MSEFQWLQCYGSLNLSEKLTEFWNDIKQKQNGNGIHYLNLTSWDKLPLIYTDLYLKKVLKKKIPPSAPNSLFAQLWIAWGEVPKISLKCAYVSRLVLAETKFVQGSVAHIWQHDVWRDMYRSAVNGTKTVYSKKSEKRNQADRNVLSQTHRKQPSPVMLINNKTPLSCHLLTYLLHGAESFLRS